MWSSKSLPLVLAAGAWLGLSLPALAEVDLAALEVVPERGQSSEQARRDRYECHNWAVDQTGTMPVANDDAPSTRERRARRTDRIISGASIGGALGGLIRGVQRKNPSNGVLAGAAVGAAVGAATSREEHAAADAADSDYLRALSACLEGRGYQVAVPAEDGAAVAAHAD